MEHSVQAMIALAPLSALAVNVLAQWAVVRGRSLSTSILGGIVAGLAVSLFWLAIALDQAEMPMGEMLSAGILVIVSYLTLSFGYWAFLNLNITSLRIRILREFLGTPGKIYTQAELTALYAPTEMLELRLSRLAGSGDIEMQDGRWWIKKPRLLRVQKIIESLRAFVIPTSQK